MPTRPNNTDWNVHLTENYYKGASAVTPNDVGTIPETKGILVGGAGNIAVTMKDGSSVTLTGLSAGTIYPLSVTQVNLTGTTATNIVALY
ncbi:hypothetical protein SAMN05877753_10212 [Bacillus oleivorans]|uniref:Uncharacterized protein n=1 Tax=Bacillus oleivorans TaxID=1448271 RepID=A0A285CL72_9BACI|nr:hypothetical protein [Bacillus oleivorans]SNX67808.1 hypothetical protein SAMN05877753_10212 [Bacillus oleivorans]